MWKTQQGRATQGARSQMQQRNGDADDRSHQRRNRGKIGSPRIIEGFQCEIVNGGFSGFAFRILLAKPVADDLLTIFPAGS
jgi:hypothetical protein